MVSKRTLTIISVVSTASLLVVLVMVPSSPMPSLPPPQPHSSPAPMVKTAPPASFPVYLSTTRTAWDAFVDGSIVNTAPVKYRECRPPQANARSLRTEEGDSRPSRALFASNELDVAHMKSIDVRVETRNVTGGAPRSCIVGPYDRDFDHIAARLRDPNSPGLAYVRYADGELGVAQGRQIGNGEWQFPGTGDTQLQKDLVSALRGHFGEEYYYGFASPYDDAHGLKWFLQRTEQSCGFISYANIWVNSHYPKTKQLLEDLTKKIYYKKVVLVVNKESVDKVNGTDDWPADFLALPDNMPPLWEQPEWRANMIKQAEDLARKYDGYLYIVSGGPPGKVIATKMWEANCRNKYVDFGSSVDPLFRSKTTRPYQIPGNHYANQRDPMWHVPTHDANAMPAQYGP